MQHPRHLHSTKRPRRFPRRDSGGAGRRPANGPCRVPHKKSRLRGVSVGEHVRRFGHGRSARRRGKQAREYGPRRDPRVSALAGKWVVVRRTCIITVVAVLGLTLFEGAASATTARWKVEPYVEIGSGTITSTAQDVTTSAGNVFGTPISSRHHGWFRGSSQSPDTMRDRRRRGQLRGPSPQRHQMVAS